MVGRRSGLPLLPLLALAALPLSGAGAQTPAAENPFVVRAEISTRSPWERSQVLYTVRIFRTAGARRFGRIRRLNDPVLLEGEALIEQLGTDRQYNYRSEGAESLVLERRYALYPQSTGELLLQPASLQWIGEDFGFRTRSFVPNAGPERLEVRAVPSPPAGRWLAAADVQLWEDFEREPNDLVAGEPLIRLLGVRVEGQPARQIPELRPGDGPNFRHFVERPEFEDLVTSGGLVGVRRQRAALLALRSGDVVLPEIRLNWWNTADERWEIAELPPAHPAGPGADRTGHPAAVRTAAGTSCGDRLADSAAGRGLVRDGNRVVDFPPDWRRPACPPAYPGGAGPRRGSPGCARQAPGGAGRRMPRQ